MKDTAGNIKKGDYIKYRDSFWQILNANFSFQGRGLANVKLKLKNIQTDKTVDLSVKSGQELEPVEINILKMAYAYQDKDLLYFLDENYEQYPLEMKNVGDFFNFLIEGEKYFLIVYENKILSIRKPEKVVLKVTESQSAVKGDTTGSAKKLVTTQTGYKVLVPLFIKAGDSVVVNPENGQYIERKKS
ncbi:MAG: elongation factor P [Patescibacteria group bacterium]